MAVYSLDVGAVREPPVHCAKGLADILQNFYLA